MSVWLALYAGAENKLRRLRVTNARLREELDTVTRERDALRAQRSEVPAISATNGGVVVVVANEIRGRMADGLNAIREDAPIYVRWFDGHGGPTHLQLRIEPAGVTLPSTSPWIVLGVVGVDSGDEMTGDDIATIPEHAALMDGGFAISRDDVAELHRQLGVWLEALRT